MRHAPNDKSVSWLVHLSFGEPRCARKDERNTERNGDEQCGGPCAVYDAERFPRHKRPAKGEHSRMAAAGGNSHHISFA